MDGAPEKAQEALVDIEIYTQESDRNTKLEVILYNTKDQQDKNRDKNMFIHTHTNKIKVQYKELIF